MQTSLDTDSNTAPVSDDYKAISLPNERGHHRLVLYTPFASHSIISYGLIVFAKNTRRWALVQRKHSVEFLIFMRGVYRITHLTFLLSRITTSECSIIQHCLLKGPSIFIQHYRELGLCENGLQYSLIRMAESLTTVKKLLDTFDVSDNKLEWNWPKGRVSLVRGPGSGKETPFDCAKREFTEETDVLLPPPVYISDNYVSENIKTLMGRNIESRYWIYVIDTEPPMYFPEHNQEVSDRAWFDTETCMTVLRCTDLFLQIINIINDMKL